jgi:hypothetical protein
MRILFALLALFGLAGIAFGVLTIVRHSSGPHGVPFAYENYGGPGVMIAGVMLIAGALYLLSVWPRRT